MASILNKVHDEFVKFVARKDDRAAEMPLTSLSHMTMLTVAYVTLIVWGPKLMAGRKAFHLRSVITVYNLLQIALNLGLVVHSIYALMMNPRQYHWQCARPQIEDISYGRTEFLSTYTYHVIKVLDLMDTVFMVLRHKRNQLSFLHVYHHLAVLWGTYLTVNYHPGGHFIFFGVLNAAVHSVMYTYYLASLWRPAVKQSLNVKRMVTLTQMVQFAVLIVHSGEPLVFGGAGGGRPEPCETHWFLLALCTLQSVFMMYMFGEFYVRNYVMAPRAERKKHSADAD